MQIFFRIMNQILPILFWITLILGFEEPKVAVLTIIAAIIHEGGHMGFLKSKGIKRHNLRGVVSGFRIRTSCLLTYKEEIMLYFAGPLANIFTAIIFSFFDSEISDIICALNIATAISNLLPVEGYDGYGILRATIEKYSCGSIATRVLDGVSAGIIFSLCILSIYFIDRFGSGYWIFGIFFFSMINLLSKWLKNTKNVD